MQNAEFSFDEKIVSFYYKVRYSSKLHVEWICEIWREELISMNK